MSYQYSNYQPYYHQLVTISFILANKRGYVLNDLGSGKSLSCLWAMDMLFEAQKIKKVLIISPLSIIEAVWVHEIKTQIPNRSYSVVHGTRDKRLKALDRDAHFYITNHDATRTYNIELMKARFDVIIIDEVTAYKTFGAQRSKGAAILCKAAKAVYGLTGTPTASGPLSAFGIAKVVNPDKLQTRYITKYKALTMQQLTEFDWIPKPGWEKVVKETLSPSIRFALEDCIDLPPIIFEDRFIDMSPKQKRLYKQMFKDQVVQFNEGLITAQNAATKFSKLLQIAAGVIIDNNSHPEMLMPQGKLAELLAILEESTVKKVVIFSQFVETAKMIHGYLEEKKVKSSLVYGKVPLAARTKAFADFQEGDTNVIVLQPRVASHGVTLTAADIMVFFGPPLGTETYLQCIGRIRRTGQSKRQVIIRISSSRVENRIYKRLQDEELDAKSLLSMYEAEV